MILATANVRNFPDMPQRLVRQDASTIAASCTLAGLQEIEPGEDTPVVREALGPDWWLVGAHVETPIIGDRDKWQVLAEHVSPFHRPDLPRPASVHGAVTSVVVQSVPRPHLPPFAVVNVHLVSNGYNGDRLPVIQDRWRIEWGIFQDECVRLHRRGLTVFTTGDLNNARPPQLRPRREFTWLTPWRIADHIGQLTHPDSVVLTGPVHERVPLNSDHPLVRVQGTLRPASSRPPV